MSDTKPARLLLNITLRYIEPPIWRRVAVAGDPTFARAIGEVRG